MKKQSFVHGAAVLAAASILCKIMSAALKIPLDRFFLHEEGIAVYQSAYSIYNVFLAICVTGIPIALSSLVAGSDKREAATLCKSTFVVITVFSGLGGVLLFLFANPLARLLSGGGRPVAALSLMILSAALPLMGFISSRRGYFQGIGNMTPSALSQLAESLAKVVLGIGICALLVGKGISYGAAGAICGVTIGAFAAAMVLEIYFRREKCEKGSFSMQKALLVVKTSIPMTLGAFGFTAVLLTDTLTVPKLLAVAGVETLDRLRMFGYLTRANTVYNLPATIITAFTASAVPAIAAARAENNEKSLGENSLKAITLIFLAAMPCTLGMVLFSREILTLLYSSGVYSILLAMTGVMVLIMPYIQTSTAMLQTLGKVWAPILVSGGAVVLKAVLNFALIPALGVVGATVATVAAFLPALVINTVMLSKSVSLKGAGIVLCKIAFCSVAACTAAKLIYVLTGGTLALLGSLGAAVIIYGILVVLLRCITAEDLRGK
ncbi:MAG: hypothetical protein E7392_00335 [Ruminococcaceae bacterium]|nr:hypothetical protein [Oscillospiraceae bacterium]